MADPVVGTEIQSPNNDPGTKIVPFRRATTRRTSRAATSGPTAVTAAQQAVTETITGSGYMAGVDLFVRCVTAGNAAAVAYAEDAPYSSISNVVLEDVNGQLVNVDGYSLHLANMYSGMYTANPAASADTNVYQLVAGVGGGIGGSFAFHLYVPTITNHRDLIGIVGNQDRAQRYTVTDDISPSASIYTVPPTAAGSVTIERRYDSYTVPGKVNAHGVPQEQRPPKLGVLHFITKNVNPSAAAGGSTVNHQLARLGNTTRQMILVFRSAGSRATAEANAPTRITFRLGDIPIFSESWADRRELMYERYGFDAPAGVLVYDGMQDFIARAGYELGEDWFWTNGLTDAFFDVTYPVGFGAGTLTVITDDLQIPEGMDIYA